MIDVREREQEQEMSAVATEEVLQAMRPVDGFRSR